jgi:Spy/CpxP family protein refolding chaperone
VRQNLAFVAGVCLISASAVAWTSAWQGKPTAKPATTTATTPPPAASTPSTPSDPSIEEVLKAVRSDLQNSRSDIIAKNVPLTTAQAAKFWPIFEQYQKEQNAIMDDQLKTVQSFVDNFDKADDAAAMRLINAHFDRDTKMVTLRQKWLTEFQKVVGTKLAVRVMQIDRRLSLAHQALITSRIPLVY